VKSYHAWLAAWELPLSFHPAVVQDWLVDYAREGNCARSLDGRLTALRRYARSVRRPFPVFGSYAWDDMKDTVKACKKVEPTKLKKATVVDVHWLRRIAGTLGVASFEDLWSVNLHALQLLFRAYACHCCMLRGVEHRDGLRLSDVRVARAASGDVDYFILDIAERFSTKKKKMCPGRACVVPVEHHLSSAGGVMLVYMTRMGMLNGASSGSHLFPLIDRATGDIHLSATTSDAQFVRLVVAQCKVAGMTGADSARVSNHSFRAGGATDASVGGCSEADIGAQGGWTSRSLRGYIRPQAHHARGRAVRLQAAVRAALRTGGGPRITPL
jgi:integrase